MITPKMSDSDWLKFFDTSYDGIIIADGKGRIVYMNPASERLEGVKKEDIIGRHAKELKDEGIYEESVTVRVLKDKKEVTITQKIGEKQLIITGVPIFKNDKIQWIFINERDITELAQLKRDYEIAKNKAEKYKRELDCLKARNNEEDKLIINSAVMEKLLTILKRVAPTDMTILIEGESGVGKDVITRWIHRHSNRSDMPFVKIDCGSLPETLLESELFGYKSGAFTGASKGGKKGLVEIADGGTLFLDEIGEVPLGLQAKLLRLLEEQVYLPVGDVKEKHVDIRIIAATNRNLKEMVDKKLFRKDLYYRLSGVPIKVPPLRQRKDDIFHFIQHFLKKYNEKYGYKKNISHDAINALCNYHWPGNVRELSNAIERLVVVPLRSTIDLEDVESVIPIDKSYHVRMKNFNSLEEAVEEFEKNYISAAIGSGKTLKELSILLDISESTVKRKLRKYNLRMKDRVRSEL